MRIKTLLTVFTLLLLLAIPVLANAWTLTVQVTGGSLTPANTVVLSGGVSKTITSGTYTLYPSTATTVTVNTAAGYTKTATVDGIANSGSSFTFSSGSHNVQVTYASSGPTTNNVAVSQTTGGTVTIQLPNGTYSTTGATNVAIGTVMPISIAASSDYSITGYTINGVTTPHSGATGEVLNIPSYSVTATPAPNTISASFAKTVWVSATLSAPTSGITGQAASYSASATSNDTGLQYRFVVTSAPSGSAVASLSQGPGSAQSFSFTPDVTGDYTVQLTVTSAGGGISTQSATMSVISSVDYSVSQCTSCHTTSYPQVVTDYNSSLHAGKISCVDCHTPTPHVALPTSSVCGTCHYDNTGNVPLHPIQIGTNPCLSCHNPHNLVSLVGAPTGHYNNVTSAGYPASYMSHRETCLDCHTGTADNAIIRPQWGRSGHSATTAPAFASLDFKYLDGCVVCHSTTGYLNYSTGINKKAWGQPADYTKELVTCIACHSNRLLGTIRNMVQVAPYPDDSFVNHNLNKSNVCTVCHIGTNNGKSIQVKVGSVDFTNTPFVAPHFYTSGGTLQGVSAYRFPGRSYISYSTNSHRGIGIGNNANTGDSGPCATCHMSHLDKHTFKAVSSASNGQIVSIISEICVNCHSSSMNTDFLNSDKTQFLNAMTVLQAMLASKGFVYSPNAPYFSNTNWGQGQDGANVMGAAFNYALFIREKGAYAHNSQYTRQIVLDSIDYLDNGQIDGSTTTLAIPQLLAAGAITPLVADSFTTYQSKPNTCTTCHGFTQASGAPNSTNAHPAHLTSLYGPATYLGPDVNACQACHVFTSTSHNNGVVDLASSACTGCHAGATPAWVSGRLACLSCHGATRAVLPNGVAAPNKANFSTSGHGQFAASNQCTVCHDQNAPHISGTLGSYTRLLLPNDNNLCASCHNGTTVGTAFRNMSTHVTIDGRSLNCRDCHDPHGTGNLHMIRSQINGATIVFTDETNGLVDPVTNRGLCQVCHTLTAHYRAGVPETSHYASGCLNCHQHNSGGGAFRPNGGSCNSCHGYPPAPKKQVVDFGWLGSWEGARFEDYSGGGGAHLIPQHVSPFADPTEGWSNCTVCHNGGRSGASNNHKMITPVKTHLENVTIDVDQRMRFGKRFTVYTGARQVSAPEVNATGTCYNVACHIKPSRRWSILR